MQLMANVKPLVGSGATTDVHAYKPAFDVGAGLIVVASESGAKPSMGFVADIRYFKATTKTGDVSTAERAYADNYVSGSSVWRTSFGVTAGW